MLSLIYITFREHCMFDWFIESIFNQSNLELNKQIQIIIVDGFLQNCVDINKRRQYFSELINSNFEFIHVSPKPTALQGKYKITKDNYFCAANTRNTGVCYAKYNYIAFVDDLGCPAQTWLESVIFAKKHNNIQIGAYVKSRDIIVKNGIMIDKKTNASGVDVRLSHYKNNISKAEISHFFGSSFCMPLDVYFKLNGMNELCDGCGGEDTDFGIRLNRAKHSFFYNKLMFIDESEDIFGSDKEIQCLRVDPIHKIKNTDLSHALLDISINGSINVNRAFLLSDYHNKIVNLKINDEEVFIKPIDEEHFFTNKLISCGLT